MAHGARPFPPHAATYADPADFSHFDTIHLGCNSNSCHAGPSCVLRQLTARVPTAFDPNAADFSHFDTIHLGCCHADPSCVAWVQHTLTARVPTAFDPNAADFSHFDMIHLGGYVSALSPFWMVAFDTRELPVPAWHPC